MTADARSETSLALDAYFERIGYRGPSTPTRAVLDAVHEAHLRAIPFENIDVVLGRDVSVEMDAIWAKLVTRQRGGWCFEQNRLLSAALRAIGFEVTDLEARVRPPGAPQPTPRAHMVLRVQAEGRDLLADVGFGATGPLHPVPLDESVVCQPLGEYRITTSDDERHVLSLRRGREWIEQYEFRFTPALAVDYQMASHYMATHPSSPFVRTLTVQRSTAEARRVLRGTEYTVLTAAGTEPRTLSPHEVPDLLRDELHLALDGPTATAVVDCLVPT